MPTNNLQELQGEERELHEMLVRRGRGIVLAAPQLFLDLDIEADGNPGMGSIASIGAITPRGDRFYIELKPDDERWVPHQREFCEEHGLVRERLIKEGLKPIIGLHYLSSWVQVQAEEEGKPVVPQGFGIGWDIGFINFLYAKHNIQSPFGPLSLDSKSLAMALTNKWDWSQSSKDKLPGIVLPEGDFTHNALEDSVYQQELGFAMTGLLDIHKKARDGLRLSELLK